MFHFAGCFLELSTFINIGKNLFVNSVFIVFAM